LGICFVWGSQFLTMVIRQLKCLGMPGVGRYPGPWIQCRGCKALESKVLDFGHWIRVPGSMALDPCNPCVGCQGLGSNGLGPSVGSRALDGYRLWIHGIQCPGDHGTSWNPGPWIQCLGYKALESKVSKALDPRPLGPRPWIQYLIS